MYALTPFVDRYSDAFLSCLDRRRDVATCGRPLIGGRGEIPEILRQLAAGLR